MKIKDMIFMGLRNLFRRKARTSLTVVGMAIGIVLIMVLASISIGVNDTINKFLLENGGMTIIYISKYSYEQDENGNGYSKEQKINDYLVEQVKEIKHVRAVSPMLQMQVRFTSGKYYNYSTLRAMDSSTFQEFGFPALEVGSYPTPENNKGMVFTVNAFWQDFYYWTGRSEKTKAVDFLVDKVTFTIDDYQYQISPKKKEVVFPVENYARMEQSDDWNYNYGIFMDLSYFKELYSEYANTLRPEDRKKAIQNLDNYEQIQINVDNMRNVTEVEEKIKELGFKTESSMQYIQPMIDTADMLQKVLVGIGLIAMMVSAINIANTMIMSIYERTKEIGVMKVLGCLVTDVKKLFLFESAILGLIGGLFGIAISYICSFFINKYGAEFLGSLLSIGSSEGAKTSQIPWWLPVAASVFAILVGVVSGYFPARRATRISAIEAMKSDG